MSVDMHSMTDTFTFILYCISR